ncbi:hypothetical protein MRB53_040035 [Persea americana]|nr:hypothetical protein MRB53_040035 [Persea americana]
MFETTFSYKSATPLPANISLVDALTILHDFETINKLNPDVRGCKPITPKNAKPVVQAADPLHPTKTPLGETQYFEVEDDLPFIPKRLWSGGVKYQADFVPVEQGCDITIHAPGGFTSVNHWRLVLDELKMEAITAEEIVVPALELDKEASQVVSKDLMGPEAEGSGWYVQIISDAKCNRTFAGFVRGFLKNSHAQLQRAFIDKCSELRTAPAATPRSRRPTLGAANCHRPVLTINFEVLENHLQHPPRNELMAGSKSTAVDH